MKGWCRILAATVNCLSQSSEENSVTKLLLYPGENVHMTPLSDDIITQQLVFCPCGLYRPHSFCFYARLYMFYLGCVFLSAATL